MWGSQSGWNAPAVAQQPSQTFGQSSVWASPTSAAQPQANLFGAQDVWGTNGSAASGTTDLFSTAATAGSTTTQKKDDPFGDLWN